jgi:hypothetical protein
MSRAITSSSVSCPIGTPTNGSSWPWESIAT